MPASDISTNPALFDYLCRLGDSTLVLGHRISEWCGHAPVLEEDIALANTALDLIGQTQMWLGLAAEIENAGRSADDLAMLRDVWEFRNLLLVEQPNGDFGQTILRQFLFDSWHEKTLDGLTRSQDSRIAGIAAKSLKEVAYHLERSRDLVVRLGDGSEESHSRMQQALDLLWPYVSEMLTPDDLDRAMADAGLTPDLDVLGPACLDQITADLTSATLTPPEIGYVRKGGKSGGQHSEHLGHLLTQMQWLQRAYPGAQW